MLVTNRSSPTSWTLSPMALVSMAQPSQSFSPMPSSREMMGYLAAKFFHMLTICCLVMVFLALGRS